MLINDLVVSCTGHGSAVGEDQAAARGSFSHRVPTAELLRHAAGGQPAVPAARHRSPAVLLLHRDGEQERDPAGSSALLPHHDHRAARHRQPDGTHGRFSTR